jgi:hypothetical protein
MNAFEALAACAGSWRGTNTLQDPGSGMSDESTSALTVTPILGDTFVRVAYAWSYQGKPQEGALLVGCEPAARAVSVHWIDTFHVGRTVMKLTGALPGVADGGLPVETPSLDAGDTLSVRGTYAAPPGPDWGWRIDITPDPGPSLRIVMFNIWPDGQREELAVDAIYARA